MKRLRSNSLVVLAALALLGLGACDAKSTSSPDKASSDDDDYVAPPSRSTASEGLGGEAEEGEEAAADDSRWTQPLPELAARPEAKEKCRGSGKRRKCTMVDPNPGLSADHGVREFLGEYRWGMSPKDVFRRLSAGVETEYAKRMEGVTDAMKQDEIRRWRKSELDKINENHVKFEAKAGHRWGASVIQYEFQDDAGEEMLWTRADDHKVFFFFFGGELWKVLRSYDANSFGGKGFEAVAESSFKPKFGFAPAVKTAEDGRKAKLATYMEWKATNGDMVRAFDLSKIYGSYLVAVIDGAAEKRVGVRLPAASADAGVSDDVRDLEGASDVCYDESGNLISDANTCKKINGG